MENNLFFLYNLGHRLDLIFHLKIKLPATKNPQPSKTSMNSLKIKLIQNNLFTLILYRAYIYIIKLFS